MSWFSTIHTPRLTIREYAEGDAEDREALMREAFESDYTLEQHRGWLDWTIASYREHGAMSQAPYGDYVVALRDTGEVVGSVGLVPAGVPWAVLPAFRLPGEPYHTLVSAEYGLFWATRSAWRGHGIAVEAARAFMYEFLFGVMRVRRVIATTDRDNLPSQRVMHKLGMTVYENPDPEPFWFQVIGVLTHPELSGLQG
ncbi:MAG: GNAT family N-acetyltransferase [Chloroflexi bacterium]|nr:GNAT family N-acetyltransferase [Chloroflexota bacterium]